MAEAPYTISVDRNRGLVRMTLRGIWDLKTFEDYAAAARRAYAELTEQETPPAACRILIDLRQHGTQPRQVAEGIQAELASGEARPAQHAVIVSESMLHRMQAHRLGATINASFFTDEETAMNWLFVDVLSCSQTR